MGPVEAEETDGSQSLGTSSSKDNDDDDMERIQVDQKVLPPEDSTSGEDDGISNEEESTGDGNSTEAVKETGTRQSSKKKVWYEKLTLQD